jgi:RimJ/RimL family protein N-acetyltransferase
MSTFPASISLRGTLVSLVPLSLDHVSDLCRYSAEPTLWTWWLRPPPVDVATMKQEVGQALHQHATGARLAFAIVHHELGHAIGSTSLLHPDAQHRSVEIGSTWLGLPFHRTGINRECKSLLLAYAFGELGVNRVVLQTDELNVRSRGAIEKLGAGFEGIQRDHKIAWNGRVRSSALYSILRKEWPR